MFIQLFILFFTSLSAEAINSTELCQNLNLVNCEGVSKQSRRSSAQSLPSVATAAQFNPANVSHDRGFGLETIYQSGNPLSFSFVSGTGKTGVALVSSKLENAFFGNSGIELDDKYDDRQKRQKQYKSDKYSLALGAGLLKSRNMSLDLGLLFKYNQDLKRVNPGAGLAIRIPYFNIGAAVYQDDVFLRFNDSYNSRLNIPYSVQFENETYQERFIVQNLFAGFNYKNLFFDVGVIKTHYKFYDDNVNIRIYSLAYIWNKFLLSLALRDETSPLPKYAEEGLVEQDKRQDAYLGVQYSVNKRLILGIQYNYYLLRDTSLSLTFFL